MTKEEIIKKYDMELVHMPSGRIFTEINGKNVTSNSLRTALFYGNCKYAATHVKGANMDSLFFHLVRGGKIEIPSDYDTCSKCGGTGNVGYRVDGGTCWKCNGVGYKKL